MNARKKDVKARAIRQAAIDLRIAARLYVEAQHSEDAELEDASEKLFRAAINYAVANGLRASGAK